MIFSWAGFIAFTVCFTKLKFHSADSYVLQMLTGHRNASNETEQQRAFLTLIKEHFALHVISNSKFPRYSGNFCTFSNGRAFCKLRTSFLAYMPEGEEWKKQGAVTRSTNRENKVIVN